MSARSRGPLTLLQFLRQSITYPSSRAQNKVTYVLGNPSADLDSIISAVIYSYFATLRDSLAEREEGRCSSHKYYIPLVNLHNVPSGRELGRLRPEFLTALKLAIGETRDDMVRDDDNYGDRLLKINILTVADVRKRGLIGGSRQQSKSEDEMNVFMVDWNALPVLENGRRGLEGISFNDGDDSDIRFSVKGCIDHHEDEHFLPSDVPLRCIQTGVGSCTSLVVRELRSRGWWADHSYSGVDDGTRMTDLSLHHESMIGESQAAKLALAAILADTSNMTAKDKVSDVDRVAVSFLEKKIKQTHELSWNREEFYGNIIEAKNRSVENLTLEEILGRDYKDWIDEQATTANESCNSPKTVKIGICSVVKPLSWLISRACQENQKPNPLHLSEHPFLNSLSSFAQSRDLDIVAIMTAYTSQPENQFQRELLVMVLNTAHLRRLREFEAVAVDKLRLQSWPSDNSQVSDLPVSNSREDDSLRIWRQMDTSMSRKQVAPLLRNVMTGSL